MQRLLRLSFKFGRNKWKMFMKIMLLIQVYRQSL